MHFLNGVKIGVSVVCMAVIMMPIIVLAGIMLGLVIASIAAGAGVQLILSCLAGLFVLGVICLCVYRIVRDLIRGWRSPTVAHAPDSSPTAGAFPLLQLHAPFNRAEVMVAFRRQAHRCHPDHGGSAALFRLLIAERRLALKLAQ